MVNINNQDITAVKHLFFFFILKMQLPESGEFQKSKMC